MKYLDENFSNVKNAFFLHHPGRLYTVERSLQGLYMSVMIKINKRSYTFPAKMERKNDMGVFFKKLFQ